MTTASAPEAPVYMPVTIDSFRNATRDITFDVFLKLSDDNFAHVFSKTTGVDYKRLAQYVQKGVKHLYIKAEEHALYEAFVKRTAEAIFNDAATPSEKKIATLLNMTEQNMAELFTQLNIEGDTAKNTQKVVRSYVDLMTSNPKTLAVILKLVSHGEYLYYHSIAVAIFSMFLAKASGQFNQRMLEIVALGGFLHDIGCTHLPKEVTCAIDDLTSEQWDVMKSHPTIGLHMVENTANVPDEVRYIIYQHHEQPSGKGYPNRLSNPVIYYPAKIVSLADAFSALISRRPFRPAHSVEQAVDILLNEGDRHDKTLVQILASVFLRQAGSGDRAA